MIFVLSGDNELPWENGKQPQTMGLDSDSQSQGINGPVEPKVGNLPASKH
jgi:hypothetical protein